MTSRAIGIDLGTTFSCVAVYKNGRVEVINNNYSRPLTPSCVSFCENGEIFVGDAAQERRLTNPANTVFGVKRLIGRRITDANVQEDRRLWPFKIVANAGDDKPLIEVTVKGKKQRFTAEDISAKVLKYLKTTAENYLGHNVTEAVITIPANYGTAQRKSTVKAAELAGFTTVKLLNEPTAAAVAYGTENLRGENQTIMVFDMGGGTCDVSILDLNAQQVFEVKATAGDMRLGGEDLDQCLMKHFAEEFKKKHGKDLMSASKAIWKLKERCENAKRVLSENDIYTYEFDDLFEGQAFQITLRRSEFEEICKPVIEKVLEPIKEALRRADLEKPAIDTVVLTGGSSRVPKIQETIKNFFSGKELSKSISPDEAIVWGAAIMVAQPNVSILVGVVRVILVEVLGASLGIEDCHGKMIFHIHQGSRLPASYTKAVVTSQDYQVNCSFPIYEGEDKIAKKNKYLGGFFIKGLPLKPKGEVDFVSRMEIDTDGMLHVSAVETSTGKQNAITFLNYIA